MDEDTIIPDEPSRRRGNPTSRRAPLKTVAGAFVAVVAFLYFLLDAAFLSIIRPISRRLARLPVFLALARAIETLSPYATLALFLVPVILLEPAKPVGFYLIATNRPLRGVAVIALGEVLKLATVERIFHIGRPKLMTIRVFAWTYLFVMGWLDWLKALPPWQAVLRRYRFIAVWIRRAWRGVKPVSR